MSAQSHFFVNRTGHRLHFLSWGESAGVPVIMLHGLRAYAQTWESLASALGDGFYCIALDQRGRGLSDWDESDNYRTASYVADLEDLVAHLGLQSFVLIGHSLGGTNSLEYARINPGRVRALVIEDIGPGSSISGDGAARIRREVSETPLQFENWNAARAFWLRTRPQLSEEGLVSRLAYSMRETEGGIVWRHDQEGIARARLTIPPPDLWPAVHALDCPTLFIRGGRSDFLPASMLAAMKESNRCIRTLEIANATHSVHDDRGDMFNGVVMGYLAGLIG